MLKVVMPQMGESIAEGTVVRWLKAPGDTVGRDEPLVEISTDKVDTEVPSPANGILREILVAEGQTVEVGAAVAAIEAADAPPAAKTVDAAAGVPAQTAKTAKPDAAAAEEPGDHFRLAQPSQTVSFRRDARADAARSDTRPSRAYSPAVLEASRQGGVSLDALGGLKGSGRGGRVTKRDVEAHVRRDRPGVEDGAPSVESIRAPEEYLYRPRPEDRRVPMSPIRRKIAHHMSWSARISPHATAFAECDMSHAAALIEHADDHVRSTVGAPLTYTVLAAQAVVRALGEFPSLNASVLGDEIIVKPSVHLGVAVALADTDDLIVPVIRNADELSLSGLALAVQDRATRARERRLEPEDVRGGTFTLTNPGIFGGLTGTPILNQPQVAILGLGAVTKRPVVIDDAIAIRPIVMLSLTFDHRAADGMIAFRYLDCVRQHLEQLPEKLDLTGKP